MTRSILFLNLACLALIIATSEGSSMYDKFALVADHKYLHYSGHNAICQQQKYAGACPASYYSDFSNICEEFFCALKIQDPHEYFVARSIGKAIAGVPCGNSTQVCDGQGQCVNDPNEILGKIPRFSKYDIECSRPNGPPIS